MYIGGVFRVRVWTLLIHVSRKEDQNLREKGNTNQ